MKPILFNTEMVQAITEGRKTVTRRVLKKQPIYEKNSAYMGGGVYRFEHYGLALSKDCTNINLAKSEGKNIPFEVGDILYVRETFNDIETDSILYAADKDFIDFGCKEVDGFLFMESKIKWKPSIHMPKAAARIFLKVSSVRAERLQDITETQVRKEGFRDYLAADDTFYPSGYYFRQTWDGTIKKQYIDKYSWDANPWVWVIEFERVEV